MGFSFSGQIALVTGATQGIGYAIAVMLARHGARVIGTAIHDEDAKKLKEKFASDEVEAISVVLDVRQQESINSVLNSIEKEYGAPSILVNNAGITRDNLALRMGDEEWDAVIDTNLKSVFRMAKAVMKPMMKARSGRIINITSVVGHAGNPGQANYCASKAGVSGMSRSLARELASRGITVNCVAPGFIDTDMTKVLEEKHRAALVSQVPLGRLGLPEDVASAVCFLASAEAGYVTGTTIHVNGGMLMD